MKIPNHLTPETWADIRDLICAGVAVNQLARLHNISPETINARSRREEWPTPGRRKRALKAARANLSPPSPEIPTPATENVPRGTIQESEIVQDAPLSQDNAVKLQESLASLVDAPPEIFQAQFGKLLQGLIAEGLPSIPAPRNASELKTFAALWSKASGLDAKASGPANAPLVNPMRTVTRRAGAAAESVVEVDPVEDFEV